MSVGWAPSWWYLGGAALADQYTCHEVGPGSKPRPAPVSLLHTGRPRCAINLLGRKDGVLNTLKDVILSVSEEPLGTWVVPRSNGETQHWFSGPL